MGVVVFGAFLHKRHNAQNQPHSRFLSPRSDTHEFNAAKDYSVEDELTLLNLLEADISSPLSNLAEVSELQLFVLPCAVCDGSDIRNQIHRRYLAWSAFRIASFGHG